MRRAPDPSREASFPSPAGEADAAMLDVVLGHADRFVALATGFIR